MKEKIIEILKKYEGIEVAYQFNVATEKESLTNKATSESIADEIIHLVNQEVEKRIKEIAKDAWFEGMKQGIKFDREDRNIKTIMEVNIYKPR